MGYTRKRCIVIFGMHRSGTSCLMGSLEHYGLYAGENSKWNPHNLKGNREHPEIVELNDAVLEYNGGSWDHPPEMLEWDDALSRRRDTILRNFLEAKRSPFGFKDPRTLLTFPFWKEGIEALGIELRLIGSFRHPEAVVSSLLHRDPSMTRERAYRLWKEYNRRLLSYYHTSPFPILAFDDDEQHYLEALSKITQYTGLESRTDKPPFYDTALLNNSEKVSNPIADKEAGKLYDILRLLPERNFLFSLKKRLTVIVNFYNMRREAKRTLKTLSATYQKVSTELYDVIAVDNGSTQPLDRDFVQSFGPNYHYLKYTPKFPSPVEAINFCARAVGSDYIMCLIDGARMLSPSILRFSMQAWRLSDHPFVYTLGMHIGEKLQNDLVNEGYDKEKEDRLLATVDWERDGYALFSVSVLAGSSKYGYFSPISESNCFSMLRDDFLTLGGFNEKFISEGGGLANLDFFNQVNSKEEFTPIMLLGEATFHQFHGGVATNVPPEEHPFKKMAQEYFAIYGHEYMRFDRKPLYFGTYKEKYHKKLFCL